MATTKVNRELNGIILVLHSRLLYQERAAVAADKNLVYATLTTTAVCGVLLFSSAAPLTQQLWMAPLQNPAFRSFWLRSLASRMARTAHVLAREGIDWGKIAEPLKKQRNHHVDNLAWFQMRTRERARDPRKKKKKSQWISEIVINLFVDNRGPSPCLIYVDWSSLSNLLSLLQFMVALYCDGCVLFVVILGRSVSL